MGIIEKFVPAMIMGNAWEVRFFLFDKEIFVSERRFFSMGNESVNKLAGDSHSRGKNESVSPKDFSTFEVFTPNTRGRVILTMLHFLSYR